MDCRAVHSEPRYWRGIAFAVGGLIACTIIHYALEMVMRK